MSRTTCDKPSKPKTLYVRGRLSRGGFDSEPHAGTGSNVSVLLRFLLSLVSCQRNKSSSRQARRRTRWRRRREAEKRHHQQTKGKSKSHTNEIEPVKSSGWKHKHVTKSPSFLGHGHGHCWHLSRLYSCARPSRAQAMHAHAKPQIHHHHRRSVGVHTNIYIYKN